jgi:tRNA-binding protein
MSESLISWGDFEKIDIRVGTVISAEPFTKAKKPAYKIFVDFGEVGIKKTSAQVTTLYNMEELTGRQVIGVINFPPRQIADFMSEFLILGVMDGKDVILLHPERPVKNGLKIG